MHNYFMANQYTIFFNLHEQSSLSFIYTFFGIFLIKLTHHKEDGEEGNLTKWVMANILLRQIRIYYYSIRFFYHAQKNKCIFMLYWC